MPVSKDYVVIFHEAVPVGEPIEVRAHTKHEAVLKVGKATIETIQEVQATKPDLAWRLLRNKREKYRWDFDTRSHYDRPWLLDTQEKVGWANAVLEKKGYPYQHWVIGDHCWYRPAMEVTGWSTATTPSTTPESEATAASSGSEETP